MDHVRSVASNEERKKEPVLYGMRSETVRSLPNVNNGLERKSLLLSNHQSVQNATFMLTKL